MVISVTTYEQLALEDEDGQWELVCGRLRQKPGMTAQHNELMRTLTLLLGAQLDRRQYSVGMNSARTRVSAESVYLPDVLVIPRRLVERAIASRSTGLEVYSEPLPLVVEVWSPSTGDYDVEAKLPEYQRRGDAEIWRLHPYERTLTTWRRQADGSYTETVYREGVIEPIALPGVRIALADLFA